MKATKYIIISLIILLFFYIFIINQIFNFNGQIISNQSELNKTIYTKGALEEKITTSDSVSVSIKRPRWYGTIYESSNNKELYLFNLINIPLKKGDKNYINTHIIFISIWFLILIITLILEFALREKKEVI